MPVLITVANSSSWIIEPSLAAYYQGLKQLSCVYNINMLCIFRFVEELSIQTDINIIKVSLIW